VAAILREDSMSEPENKSLREDESISIDYDRIDAASIMDQIKKKVARQKEEKGVEVSAEPVPDIQFSFEASPSQEPPGLKKRVKAKLVKMLRPLFPFLRVLALPVHEDLMKVVASLHETNRRIDQLDQRCTQINNTLGEKIGEVSSDLNAALSTLGEELRAELGNLSQTLFQMRADLSSTTSTTTLSLS
jgi:hypothetical protein